MSAEPAWQKLAPGVEYKLSWVNSKEAQPVHLLRWHPSQARLRHLSTSKPKTSQQFLQAHPKSLAVFNGGYFDPKGRPLGLLYDGQWVQRQVATGSAFGGLLRVADDVPSLWPVLQVSDAVYESLLDENGLSLLLQCGPRLIADGKSVAGLEKGYRRRTAIAADAQGRLLLLASAPHYLMSFADLQNYLKNQLKVSLALNLDGGSSTQSSVRGQPGGENPGYSPLPFALGLFAR